MTKKARAVVYERPLTFSLREFPLPDLGPGDMLVEIELGGVDGSELHMFRGELEWLNEQAPLIFGDEIIGRVCVVGDDVASERELQVGDRIAVESRWPCNECRYCKQRQYYLCLKNGSRHGYGAIGCTEPPHLWGGYASHVFVPAATLAYRVADALQPKAALVGCSTLANSVRWSEQIQAAPGRTVVVVGPGPQGLGCALAAANAGARVIVTGLEQDSERLRFAREFGKVESYSLVAGQSPEDSAKQVIEKFGEIDAVIETAGSQSAKDFALHVVRPTGTIAHISLPFPPEQTTNWLQMLMKEVTVLNPMSHPHFVDRGLALAEALLRKGIDVGEMISDIYPLEQAEHAIRVASYQTDKKPLKVALDPNL